MTCGECWNSVGHGKEKTAPLSKTYMNIWNEFGRLGSRYHLAQIATSTQILMMSRGSQLTVPVFPPLEQINEIPPPEQLVNPKLENPASSSAQKRGILEEIVEE